MFRSVFEASCTALCVASSQLSGDCDNNSMTLTTLAITIILLPLIIADGCWIAREDGAALLNEMPITLRLITRRRSWGALPHSSRQAQSQKTERGRVVRPAHVPHETINSIQTSCPHPRQPARRLFWK